MAALRNLLGYAFNHQKKTMISGLGISFFWSFLFIGKPYLTGVAFDAIISDITAINTIGTTTWLVLFLILSFIVSEYAVVYILHYLCGVFSARTAESMRNDIFQSLQKQSHKYYDDNSTGDLVSKATSDTNSFANFLYFFLLAVTLTFGEFFFIVCFLFIINVEFAIVCLLAFPVMWFITRQFQKRYTPLVYESRQQFGQLSKIIQENIAGSKISHTFDSVEKDFHRFNKENTKYFQLQTRAIRTRSIMFPLVNLFSGIMRTFVLIYGALLIMDSNGSFTIGMLVSSIMLSQYLRIPLNNISNLTTSGSEASAASQRVFTILESVPEIRESPTPIKFTAANRGEIAFRNVSFGYKTEPVLENIDLTIPAGTNIAILGGTGSGKSSLINLIPRFYDVTNGVVEIDGTDIREFSLDTLRKNIGYVDQETFLFSCTIKENIAFGKPDANEADIVEVAKVAHIHDFIMSLPDKYETKIGERGVTLSGGQRQRISIARALLINPKIVIFDDSLSAVDMKTEKGIQQALTALLKNRTTIFVTQRLSTTVTADQIVIIHKGRIVEVGIHTELLNQGGIYSKLYETQIDGLIDLSILEPKEVVAQ